MTAQKKGPEIPNDRLRTLLSKSVTSLVIIGSCDLKIAVKKINAGTRSSGTDFLGLRRFGIVSRNFPSFVVRRNPLQAPRFNLVLLGVRPTFPQGTSARFLSLEGADVLARLLGT